jgi:hypothetical protein
MGTDALASCIRVSTFRGRGIVLLFGVHGFR